MYRRNIQVIIRYILFVFISAFLTASATAETETVGEKTYKCIKILDKSVFDSAITSLQGVGFSGSEVNPPVTLENVCSEASDYGGVLLWISHGSTDGSNGYLAIEKYGSESEAETRADALMSANTYYTYGDLIVNYLDEDPGWWIFLTSSCVANKFSGNNSIAAIASCYGGLISNWGDRISIGYGGIVESPDAETDMTTLFANLSGANGTDYMSTDNAITENQVSDGEPTALIPYIYSVTKPSYNLSDTLNTICWTFGTSMDQSGFPYVGGYAVCREWYWSDDYNLVCKFYCGWAMGEVFVGLDSAILKSTKEICLLADDVHYFDCQIDSYPPAASVASFIPFLDSGGVTISIILDMWRASECFWIERDDGTLIGDTVSVESINGNSFEVFDPGGCLSNHYWFYEIENDGDEFIRADEGVFDYRPDIINTMDLKVDQDKSEQIIIKKVKSSIESVQSGTLGIIIVPDAWENRAQVLADFWNNLNKPVLVVTLSESGNTREEIRACIEGYYLQGVRYVLLGAGAHDEWFDDATRWPDLAGDEDWYWWYIYYHDNYSSSPERNIIPTWYYEDPEYDNMSYWTPYYSSDYGYVDDLSGLRLGRFPAYSEVEFRVLRDKTIHYVETAENVTYANDLSLWAYCHDSDGNSGRTVELLSDELSAYIPPEITQHKLYDYSWNYTVREANAIADWTNGKGYIFMNGTASTPYKPIHFFDKSLGWNINTLSDNEYFPVLIGASCGIGALDMFLSPTYGVSVGQDLLTADSKRGTCIMIAPTRGTEFEGNRKLGKWISHYSLNEETWDIGTMFMLAREEEINGTESFTVRSYNLYGDPMAPLPGKTVITDDNENIPSLSDRLEQNYPNPFNPNTVINYSIKNSQFVSLKIFDLAGRQVRTLVEKAQPAGTYMTTWDGKNDCGRAVATGVYFYRIKAGSYYESKKLILLR